MPRTLAPGLYDRLAPIQTDKDAFQEEPAPNTSGSLFAPRPPAGVVGGGWRNGDGLPVGRLLGLGAAALLAVGLLRMAPRGGDSHRRSGRLVDGYYG